MPTDEFSGPSYRGGRRFSNPTSVNNFITNRFSVTNSSKVLTAPGGTTDDVTPLYSGVRIKADAANAEPVYIAGGRTASATGGFPISANEEVFIDIDRLEFIRVASAGGGETITYIGS
jgi:hypothetical protein